MARLLWQGGGLAFYALFLVSEKYKFGLINKDKRTFTNNKEKT